MTDTRQRTVLSVRGEAQRTVQPDRASMHCSASGTGDTKVLAIAAVRGAIGRAVASLSALGGEALTVDTMRAPLTWSTLSIHTEWEYATNKMTGEHRPTGRHRAMATMVVTVSNFSLLDQVEEALSDDEVDIQSVSWVVDHDNAAWAAVRADAIAAALKKGRDYATALRGAVQGVEHVADDGLLGSENAWNGARASRAMEARGVSGALGGGPSLDPAPQVISAVIEARFTADIEPLVP